MQHKWLRRRVVYCFVWDLEHNKKKQNKKTPATAIKGRGGRDEKD